MTNTVDYVQQSIPLDGTPTIYTVGGSPFTGISRDFLQEETTFRSADNPGYVWFNGREGIRKDTIRQQTYKQNIDWGNGLFYKESITRDPLYGPDLVIKNPFSPGYAYQGPMAIGIPISGMKSLITQGMSWATRDDATLLANAAGATLMSRALPTKSHLSLAVSLAELRRDGLPKLIGASLVKPRSQSIRDFSANVGNEYLNVQFGWAPVIRDFVSLLQAVTGSAQLMREYHNMSKKHIRRRRQLPTVREISDYTGATEVGTAPTNPRLTNNRFGTARPAVHRVYTQRTWFSGAFRFGLPYGDSLMEQVAYWESEANHLLSVRITPEVLWNTTAWSWLSDWFANIGDVMTNISHIGLDGLVLHYGYVMQHTRVNAHVSLPGITPFGHPSSVAERVILERKMRLRASPYGFGIKAADLTQQQWAILGALGLSKSHGVL